MFPAHLCRCPLRLGTRWHRPGTYRDRVRSSRRTHCRRLRSTNTNNTCKQHCKQIIHTWRGAAHLCRSTSLQSSGSVGLLGTQGGLCCTRSHLQVPNLFCDLFFKQNAKKKGEALPLTNTRLLVVLLPALLALVAVLIGGAAAGFAGGVALCGRTGTPLFSNCSH